MVGPGVSYRVIDHYPKTPHWWFLHVYSKSLRLGMATGVTPVMCCSYIKLRALAVDFCGCNQCQSPKLCFHLFPLIFLAPASAAKHAESNKIIVYFNILFANRLCSVCRRVKWHKDPRNVFYASGFCRFRSNHSSMRSWTILSWAGRDGLAAWKM